MVDNHIAYDIQHDSICEATEKTKRLNEKDFISMCLSGLLFNTDVEGCLALVLSE